MKRLYRVLCILCSLCLAFGPYLPAAAKEEYTYTIRFFAGRQGSFAEGEMMVFEGLRYGDRVNFYQSAVALDDNSKYYIRGIRESGKDNSESTQASSFLVTGDRDYVIAYGILGDATSYTINYVDTEGNALAPSETYYGNVGDKPVVAYLYIEGWQPQAYNMTQTLKKDPAENVFDFVYTRVETPAPEQPGPAPGGTEPTPPGPVTPPEPPTEGGVVVLPAGPDDGPPADDGGPDDGGPDDGGPYDGGDDAPDDDGGEEQELPDPETPTGQGPDEMRDLDDEGVPTSNFLSVAADAKLLGIPLPVVLVLVVGAVGAAWYFLMMGKRKKRAAEEESEQ